MYIVYVWEEFQWKVESIQPSAEDAEFHRIQMSYQDDRERDIKRMPLELGSTKESNE